MANRKVLINRHTSGSTAPVASTMYKGEIAVAHKTGEETIWTKNNDDVMVPFISCAQTIAIIDSKIAGSEDSVVAKEGESHIEVESAGTTAATVWKISSKDVQSEDEFKDYSARTNSAIMDLTAVVSALTDIVVTGITGDSIITATVVDPVTGSNAYNLTHKTGHESTGFNKLATDAYGHVIASTAVSTSDIEALGFKTSADTEAAISAAIEALDSSISASSAGKYFTALAIEDGKLVAKEEADIPVLEVESAGTGNVVASITVEDHKITYQTASVATSEGIAELSAATIALSAGTVHDIEELSGATQAISGYAHDEIAQLSGATEAISGYAHDEIDALSAGTIQLSGDVVAYVNQLSGYAHGEIVELSGATVAGFNSAFTAIQGMDKGADAVDGQVVTTVAQEDGKVTETKASVKDLQLGGYVKNTSATGDIAGTDTINTALSKLENKANANAISNADGSINVTTAATGTDINVNIKSGEHVLAKDGNAGLYTNIKLSGVSPSSDLVKEEYVLYGTDNTILGDHIKIYKDQSIVSITLEDNDGSGHTGQYLKYTYIDASGATQSTYVNVSSFLVESEFKSGVTADASGVVHGVVDPNSESFLTVGADGFKVSGVQDAINAKVNALDVTGDTAIAGQYVAAIEQTDGLVAVKTRANVSEAVLTNYVKDSDATAVAATDTVNQAISKLENQVDAAKAAATTKVVEGTDAGNNMTITPSTSATDGSVTYTIDLTDIASDAALEAVSGIVDTFSAATVAEFSSAFTAINTLSADAHNSMIARDNAVFSSAVTYVDEQIDEVYASAVSYTDSAITYAIEGLDSVGSASTTGHYLTSVTITDGKISAVGEEELPTATPVTAVNGTTGDTASAVIAEVVTGGTEGHQLTLNYSNKVFSATTADSALTSQSALTSVSATVAADAVHASAATKVDSALTLTDVAGTNRVEFDGSANKTVTFGTATSITSENSMTMSDSGVVDVNIIDCGEY